MATLGSAPVADGSSRLWGRLGRADRLALCILVCSAILFYVPLSIAGHPLIPGDDLTQNYPLRVLSGSLIRSGHFPTWDPFIWSGTPLLAGWNAGALYPGTWAFAVLPGVAAWTVNLVSVSLVAGVGVFVLLRMLRCGPLGATLGGLCFTYTGFMSGQLAHIGLVEGSGYVAWMLVAIELLVGVRTAGAAIWPVLLLAASVGLCVLAGEPRAVSSAAVVVLLYVAARLVGLSWRLGLRLAATTIGGVSLGMGIAAVQWLPGLTFVARSQRTLDSYQAFGAGSLNWETIGHNLLVPFLLGGNTNFGLPIYDGGYNLAEVTIGVGLLPLVAACAYLPGLARRGRDSLRRSARGVSDRYVPGIADVVRTERRLGVWYLMGIVGTIVTLGTSTPIGRFLVDIPLYGGERLQSRNSVIFDLALAVLLAFFITDVVSPERGGERKARVLLTPLGTRSRRAIATLPVLGCLVIVVLAYARPIALQLHLGVANPTEDFFKRLTPYLVVTVAIALILGLFIVLVPRLSHSSKVAFVVILAGADLGVYLANGAYATVPKAVLDGTIKASTELANLTKGNRFALYDPLDVGASQGQVPSEIGKPDVNVLRGISSVQGYGSIVSGTYQDETNTHSIGYLDPAVLRNGLASELDLGVLLTPSIYLAEGIPPHSAIPVAGESHAASVRGAGKSSVIAAPAPLASGPWSIEVAAEREYFLPSVSTLRRVSVVVDTVGAKLPLTIDLGFGRPGSVSNFTAVPVVRGQASYVLPKASPAEFVTIRNPDPSKITIGAVVVVTSAPADRLLLDGSLQGSLSSSQWSFDGHIGPYSIFLNRDPDGLAWLQASSSPAPTAPLAGLGSVTTTATQASGAEKMVVVAKRPARLVRSVAFEPGSEAKLTPIGGGPVRSLSVKAFGLIQAVEIPAGKYRVSWSYAPRSLVVGGVLTLASVAGAAFVAAFAVFDLRRRRRSAPSRAAVLAGSSR